MRLLGAAAVFLVSAAAAQSPSIQLNNGVFRVTGWTAPPVAPAKGWLSVLAVYAGSGNVPPMLGSHAIENGSLVFRPRFPLAAGVQYRVVFRPPGGGSAVESTFSGPARDTTRSTRVDRVYPSGDVLPANQLRIYIYFSAPMSQGEAGSRMRLLDADGREVPNVFLPGEELWDPGFQRLTMTLDPGRIKRGLTSNQSIGLPIVEGRRYTLAIDKEWLDARGVPLVEGFRKSFRGGPAQRTPPDPKGWIVTAPTAVSAAPLTVWFPVPLNYVLLQRMLWVMNGNAAVEGTISVERQETIWKFTPRQPWPAGRYELVVDTAIEDLAGNHVGQPFDIDVFEHVTERIAKATVSLPFTVH
jgi:hypothetical protein